MPGINMNSVLRDMNRAPVENVTGSEKIPVDTVGDYEGSGKLRFPGEIRKYILGGNSCFTIRCNGVRRTYKVKSTTADRNANWSTGNQDRSQYFISLKTGPGDSFSDYSYMGMLRQTTDGDYRLVETAKSQAKRGSAAWDLFAKLWYSIERGCRVPSNFEFWHEGSCCMCGRRLTVPSSIESGIGPECAGKAWI